MGAKDRAGPVRPLAAADPPVPYQHQPLLRAAQEKGHRGDRPGAFRAIRAPRQRPDPGGDGEHAAPGQPVF